ncbi:MAG: TolC family protein [Bacteroidetes bacterium HGW-Bacteroidetes-17]|nr:MAG: TolC family protein [Bacteroidetes bacterium HGW-Bacteroidetes-17]
MKYLKITMMASVILFTVNLASAQTKLTLEDAMEIALQNSPDISKARLNMEQNKEYLNAQLASLKSRFSFEVTPFSYSKTDTYNDYFSEWYTSENKGASGSLTIAQPIKFSDGTLVLKNDFGYQDNYAQASNNNYKGYNNNLYLQYIQPLFTYNRTKMNLEKNQLNLENATLAYAIEMLNLERLVNQAFYSIYQKQMAYEIAKEEYENQKVSKEIIESKVEGDLSAKEELYQAELNLATSKSSLDNSLVNLENAKDQFKQLIGMSLYEEVEVITDIKYAPVSIDLEKAISNGLSQRLELSQRQINLDNAQFNLIETSATNEFRGDMRLSVGIIGNNEKFQDIYSRPTKSPQVGVTFSIPIFDWGERKARIRAAEIEIETLKIDKKTLEDDIIINIRQVYRNLNNLVLQIGIAEQNDRNAQLTYEINLERYKNGDLTSMDLQRYQTQLSSKKMEMSNSLINYKLELLNMKIQSLWDFEKNTSFVPQELQKNINK